jgi:lysophosphatidate acyltransferase
MLPFKKGAFHLAIETQHPIVPIIVSDLNRVADFHKKIIQPGLIQIRCKERTAHRTTSRSCIKLFYTIIFLDLEPISTTGLGPEDVDKLLKKTRDMMVEGLKSLNALTS